MKLAAPHRRALSFVRNNTELVMDAEPIPFEQRSKWLIDRELCLKFATQLPQITGIPAHIQSLLPS
jgi:hypothetical protein